MYVGDDLIRLNDKATVREYQDRINSGITCDWCDQPAKRTVEYYNPADEVRTPPLTGIYSVSVICDECYDKGYYLDEAFYCDGCGKLFVINHSWDLLAVLTDDGYACQKCFIEYYLESVTLGQVIEDLHSHNTGNWKRINNIPGHEKIWSGEYSDWSDFPGHTSPESLAGELVELINDRDDIAYNTKVYPVVTHGYQFSVVLGIFKA